jgi:hypothetical protein
MPILLLGREYHYPKKDGVQSKSNSHYENRFFESQPAAGFQKTDFDVSNAKHQNRFHN